MWPAADLLCAIFALSGASSLAFETLWFHQAGLALGNSVWASSLVLAGFMGGLGRGQRLSPLARGDRLRATRCAPSRLLEAGSSAVSGLALVVLLPRLTPVLAHLLAPLAAAAVGPECGAARDRLRTAAAAVDRDGCSRCPC